MRGEMPRQHALTWLTLVLCGVSFFFLKGCAVGPNYRRPATPIPTHYVLKPLRSTVATRAMDGNSQSFVVHKDIPAEWWALFHSKALNELVMASLQHNPSIGAAKAALQQALENVYAARGGLFPFVAASFTPSTQQTAKILTSVLASNQYHYSLYTGQLFVSYTPDVFGGTRRQIESLKATATFQALQLEATYLTLTSNVVNAAIQEASLREQILATNQMIAHQKKILKITNDQAHAGDASIADIATQEAALAATEATLPPLEKQLAVQRDLLNALTGRFPDDERTPRVSLRALTLPHELPISLPSTLLEHRPDIRAAEETMHAANALIGVAVANRLPNVTIGFTNMGTAATSLTTLFSTTTQFWALAGIITQPIFDAGTLKHRQRAAEAAYLQAAAEYRLTVINAFQNVADTLKAIRVDAIGLGIASKAERAALKSLSITEQQRAIGDSSAVALLLSQKLYQQAKLNTIQAQANRLSDTVALFQALGGGWWNAPPPCIK